MRPALLIAGGSAYPRAIDFERMAAIAEAVEARLLVDMAHIAGLVAAGVHASPLARARPAIARLARVDDGLHRGNPD